MRRAARDLLIEHLHRLQDRFGCLRAAHLVALAAEMKLAMAEVYEVASFYHHFDVVKEGEAPPPPITVRVCETLSCEMAGADALRVARRRGARRRRARAARAVHRPLRARAGRGRRAATRSTARRCRRSIDAVQAQGGRAAGRAVHRLRGVPRRRRLRDAARLPRRHAQRRRRRSRRWNPRRCAAWAAPAFRPGANGRSCAPSPRRG